MKKVLLLLFAAAIMFSPVLAAAQLENPNLTGTRLPGSDDPSATASDWIFTFINVGLGIVGLIAVAFIIYGGFRYVTAGGNDDASESAKKIITNAIIGLVVVILSAVIVNVIINGLVWQRV